MHQRDQLKVNREIFAPHLHTYWPMQFKTDGMDRKTGNIAAGYALAQRSDMGQHYSSNSASKDIKALHNFVAEALVLDILCS